MARRSPTNPRYQKHAKVGSTRRSAASMKPKRERAEPVTKAKAEKKATSTGRGLPDVPEVRFYNRLYIALFVVALLSLLPMVLVPVFSQYVLKQTVTVPKAVTAILWGVYAAAIGGALYVQTGPLRKLKAAALKGELPSQQAEAKSGKTEKAEKTARTARTEKAEGSSADEGEGTSDGKDA